MYSIGAKPGLLPVIIGSLMLTACASNIPRPAPFPDSPYGHEPREAKEEKFNIEDPDNPTGTIDVTPISEVKYFLALDSSARKAGVDPQKNLRYLNSGFGISDRMCSEWFSSLETSRQTAEYRQGTAALTGTMTGTVMGLFKSASREVGAAAAVFGGINGWYDMGKATFFLTPKLGTVQTKLAELRDAMANDFRQDSAITASYERAHQALSRYQDSCGTLELQRFIDSAAEIAKYEYKPAGALDPGTNIQVGALTVEFLKAIQWPVSNARIDPRTLKKLYFFRFEPDLATKLAYDKDALVVQLNSSYPAEGSTNRVAADRLLASIGSLLNVQADIERARAETSAIETDTQQKIAALQPSETMTAAQIETAKTQLMTAQARRLQALGTELSSRSSAAPAQINVVPSR
jgi:hypothetical protein